MEKAHRKPTPAKWAKGKSEGDGGREGSGAPKGALELLLSTQVLVYSLS
jgi:hypothetical protein